jgi:pimeloyl-ACP methyl ester carboxylesterase
VGQVSRVQRIVNHGFPELAYSWRKVMPALASAGYRVIAPDRRGYGRTAGWDDAYDVDLMPFRARVLSLQEC